MKYLVDANLPYKLCIWLITNKYDATHTDNLINKEFTTDTEIRNISNQETRIVITKDSDFFYSCLLNNSPEKLLLISTGNILNNELFKLFEDNFSQIVDLFEHNDIIELDKTSIIIHNK